MAFSSVGFQALRCTKISGIALNVVFHVQVSASLYLFLDLSGMDSGTGKVGDRSVTTRRFFSPINV